MEHFEIKPPEGEEVCDFCLSNERYAVYQCEDFVAETAAGFELSSKGPWAACPICSGFIERQEWRNLLERSVRKFVELTGVPDEIARPSIARNHQLFIKHRKMAA
jgi:hypothetical protein